MKLLELVFTWQQHIVLAAPLLGTQNIVTIYLELYIYIKTIYNTYIKRLISSLLHIRHHHFQVMQVHIN